MDIIAWNEARFLNLLKANDTALFNHLLPIVTTDHNGKCMKGMGVVTVLIFSVKNIYDDTAKMFNLKDRESFDVPDTKGRIVPMENFTNLS
jgi:hypothetical protein